MVIIATSSNVAFKLFPGCIYEIVNTMEKITIVVQYRGNLTEAPSIGMRTKFKLKTSMRLRKMMKVCCCRFGLHMTDTLFSVNNAQISMDATCKSLGLKHRDVVDVVPLNLGRGQKRRGCKSWPTSLQQQVEELVIAASCHHRVTRRRHLLSRERS